MKNLAPKTLIAFAILFLASSTALGQGNGDAAISGKVLDTQGGVLHGATVTLYGDARNLRLTTTTDSTGVYRF